MKITKHAQSCFLIEIDSSRILIDPGNFVFEDEGLKPEDFPDIDLIIITHEHKDHFDQKNISTIIRRDNPVILTTHDVAKEIIKLDPNANIQITSNKLKREFNGFSVTGILSKHGPLPTGVEPPNVLGILIAESGSDNTFYHPGDTLQLNATAKIIAVPICGKVVLDIEQAKAQLLELKPKIAIPIHYNHPIYKVDVRDFEKAMAGTGIEVRTLDWGKSFTVES